MKWEDHYIESQRLYDPTVERGPDLANIKLANRLGKPRVEALRDFILFKSNQKISQNIQNIPKKIS